MNSFYFYVPFSIISHVVLGADFVSFFQDFFFVLIWGENIQKRFLQFGIFGYVHRIKRDEIKIS